MMCVGSCFFTVTYMILILAMLPRIHSQQFNIFGEKFRQHPRFGENQETRTTAELTSTEDMMIHKVLDLMDEMMTEKDNTIKGR